MFEKSRAGTRGSRREEGLIRPRPGGARMAPGARGDKPGTVRPVSR